VNCATEKCDTKTGSYGEGVEVLRIEGLLDDPDARKKVDAMPEGEEKEAARAALPSFPPEECAGDAKKDFERVITAMEAAKAGGGACMVHCYASLSRSVAFIMAYMMKTEKLTVVEAAKQMKEKWDAVWPNDSFVAQLIEYESELGVAGAPGEAQAATGVPGEVHMKVTASKSSQFYIAAAKGLLAGVNRDGTTKEPACVLKISGLGEAVSNAATTAAMIVKEGLGFIKNIETSYPRTGERTCAKIDITVYHK